MVDESFNINSKIAENIANWKASQEKAEEPIQEEKAEDVHLVQEESQDTTSEKKETNETTNEETSEEIVSNKEDEKEGTSDESAAVINVNGKEIQLTEKDLIAYAQKGYASDEKFQKAAQISREAERKIAAAQTIYAAINETPLKTLEQLLGKAKLRELTEQWLSPIIEEEFKFEAMSDMDKAKLKAQRELSEIEQKTAMKKQQHEKAEYDEQVAYYERSIQEQVTAGMKQAKLPQNEGLIKKIYAKMYDQINDGELNVNLAIKSTMDDMVAEQALILQTLPAEEVNMRFGATAEQLRKARLADAKKGKVSTPQGRVNKPSSKSKVDERAEKVKRYLANRVDLPLYEESDE